MNGSKSFGVRMPLEMYLKMVEVCSKNGVTQTDLVLYALNRVGLFSDEFKVGGEVEIQEKIVYRNEPELLEENKILKKQRQQLSQGLENQMADNKMIYAKLDQVKSVLKRSVTLLNIASRKTGDKDLNDMFFELNSLLVEVTNEEL